MTHALAVILSLAFLGADGPKKDQDLLQGEWTMQSLEVEGVPVDQSKLQGTTLLIQGDKYTIVSRNPRGK